jgi:SMC interacting uncharacterized protein involved in chromosome segregation
MEIPKDLKDEIKKYCILNDITDLSAFMVRMLRQGYNIEKYGTTPLTTNQGSVEVIEKEVIKEIPIEVIREIEKIVEVPVEVIREVEKIVEVNITDNEEINNLKTIINELGEKITKLEKELEEEKQRVINSSKSDDNNVRILKQQIENLKIELELEQNRNLYSQKIEPPKKQSKDIINWVSKEDNSTDLYEE